LQKKYLPRILSAEKNFTFELVSREIGITETERVFAGVASAADPLYCELFCHETALDLFHSAFHRRAVFGVAGQYPDCHRNVFSVREKSDNKLRIPILFIARIAELREASSQLSETNLFSGHIPPLGLRRTCR
jgi:hypothetical protein